MMKLDEFGAFPTLTAPTGPFHGMSDKAIDAEAAFKAATSASLAPSTASKLQTNWVSVLNPTWINQIILALKRKTIR